MRTNSMTVICGALIALAIGTSSVGAPKPETAPQTPLTEAGQKLQAQYADQLESLRTELAAKAPQVDPAKRQAYDAAAEAVAKATDQIKKAEKIQNPNIRNIGLKPAQDALAEAKARMAKIIEESDLGKFLASDSLDAKLVKYVVLFEATPHGLAEFAQQGKQQEALVEKLLADADLMKQMLVADGANAKRDGRGYGPAQYGQAMKIYADIQKASQKAATGVFQRLALAISLEHAVPVEQANPKARTDAPETVDPVKRYLHYEKA